ncbi:MAG: type III pantothenate kinase [Phycisphaeraceae bacterium]|nr:MAG: type III pantothenate kinase [Phycisphaeraceae bacterium]
MSEQGLHIIAINVGNTRTSFGLFEGGKPAWSRALPNDSIAALVQAIGAAWDEIEELDRSALVMASVNPPQADRLAEELGKATKERIYRIGPEVPIPMDHTVDDVSATGQDRLLAAFAAFNHAGQACVVVDAGTAITVDFVDGVGVFHGGAIGPGVKMMLRSLHQGAAQLPELEPVRPDENDAYGRNTTQAMLNGVFYGARGMVRALAERYAEHYGAYPQVIATGGDARLLFEGDELIEHIVDDLVLRGVALAASRTMVPGDGQDDE